MMKNLLKLIVLSVIGLISYNYFYGNMEEKARSEKVINGVKDVFHAIKDLAVAEKEKFDAGKYDQALEKIGHLFKDFKEQSLDISEDLRERFAALEQEKDALDEHIDKKKKEGVWTEEEEAKTKKDFADLIKKTEALFQEIEE
jgi:hypothetical protein